MSNKVFEFKMYPNDFCKSKIVTDKTDRQGNPIVVEISATEFMKGIEGNKPMFKYPSMRTRKDVSIPARNGSEIYNVVAWSNMDEVGKKDGKRVVVSSNGRPPADWMTPRDEADDIEESRYLKIDIKAETQDFAKKKSDFDF